METDCANYIFKHFGCEDEEEKRLHVALGSNKGPSLFTRETTYLVRGKSRGRGRVEDAGKRRNNREAY